jgi:rSAM/selenodomain-associated transferase 2
MPNRPPSLSIVIPALNEAETLPRLLAQLAGARARGAEVVVVDGGSTDGTARIAEEAGVRVVWSPAGRARQLQAGVDATNGEAVWLLHGDSDVDPMCDQHVIWSLANTLRPWGRFSVRLGGRHPLLFVVGRMMNLRSRLTGVATGDQGIFVVREVLERIGGIPQLPLMEDVELSKRLRAICPPICLLKRVTTSARRWEQHGVVRTIALMWQLRFDHWRGVDAAELARRYRASDDERGGAAAA